MIEREDASGELDQLRVELGSGAAAQLLERVLGADRVAVGAALGHRLVGVADEDDPRAERDLLACEPVRIAVAVPALVARADQRRDRCHRRRRRQDPLADRRVGHHQRPLVVVERPDLVQDAVGDRDLADVVELRGADHRVELLRLQVRRPADLRRQPARPPSGGRRAPARARAGPGPARPGSGAGPSSSVGPWPRTCGRRRCAARWSRRRPRRAASPHPPRR